MLFQGTMRDEEVMVVHGCRRYSAYSGYLHSFRCTGAWTSAPAVQSILTIDAVVRQHFSGELQQECHPDDRCTRALAHVAGLGFDSGGGAVRCRGGGAARRAEGGAGLRRPASRLHRPVGLRGVRWHAGAQVRAAAGCSDAQRLADSLLDLRHSGKRLPSGLRSSQDGSDIVVGRMGATRSLPGWRRLRQRRARPMRGVRPFLLQNGWLRRGGCCRRCWTAAPTHPARRRPRRRPTPHSHPRSGRCGGCWRKRRSSRRRTRRVRRTTHDC